MQHALFSIRDSTVGGVQDKNSQQREAAFGCLTTKTVNDQLHYRLMNKLVIHILTLVVVALSLVLFASGCGPL
jgi:hypothetical protein